MLWNVNSAQTWVWSPRLLSFLAVTFPLHDSCATWSPSTRPDTEGRGPARGLGLWETRRRPRPPERLDAAAVRPAGDSTLGTREGETRGVLAGSRGVAGQLSLRQASSGRVCQATAAASGSDDCAPEAREGAEDPVPAAAFGAPGRGGRQHGRLQSLRPPSTPSGEAPPLVCPWTCLLLGPGPELESRRLIGTRGTASAWALVRLRRPITAEATMEQCASVEREVDKVLQKFLTYGQHCEQTLEELLHHVSQLRAELASAALQRTPLSATLSLVMSQCCRKIKDTVQKLALDHKDIHSSVSRVGKAIDRVSVWVPQTGHRDTWSCFVPWLFRKASVGSASAESQGPVSRPRQNFDSEVCGVVSSAVWDSQEKQQQVLQEAIVEHLYRQGLLGVAEELCQESMLNVDLDFKRPFLELNRILETLHKHDLGPALEWAISHRQRLLELNSSLEFKLHRLHFICLLAGGPDKQLEALSYARHFQPFAWLHQWEIQVMMGSLVYLRLGLEKSPYCHLLDDSHWAEICETFTRNACSLLGLSVESPLSVSFASGCVALPVLMNIRAVIEQRQCMGIWSHKDELPIEIELGMKCWYHSVFACPILRQQTSDSNPPIKLTCGHVISQDALNKLNNGGKLKCPYCPMEQNTTDGKRIIF